MLNVVYAHAVRDAAAEDREKFDRNLYGLDEVDVMARLIEVEG